MNPLTSYPAWKMSGDVFTTYAKSHNVDAHHVGPNKIDIPKMIQLMDQAIADKADGIITCDLDPKSFAAEISKAQDAGVVVVTIGCVDDISNYSIGTDNKEFGRAAADAVAAKAGKDARVGVISTDQATPNQVEQVKAFKAEMADKYPDMKIVGWESDNSDTATAASKISALVQANPDLNAIWCVEGNCPAAVQPGLSSVDKKPGDVYALGIDDVDTTIAAIKAGWVTETLNQCYFVAPPLAVELIRAVKDGHPSSQQSYAVGVDPITKDNLPYNGCPSDIVPKIQ